VTGHRLPAHGTAHHPCDAHRCPLATHVRVIEELPGNWRRLDQRIDGRDRSPGPTMVSNVDALKALTALRALNLSFDGGQNVGAVEALTALPGA
jgi:hypothetical protein